MTHSITRANEHEVMRSLAEHIAASITGPHDPRLEVAYSIARYLRLDWPAAVRKGKWR